MNNDQFRRLIGANTPTPSANSNGQTPVPPRSSALGSRQKSSIPMTPRSVSGLSNTDFARQLAERKQGDKTQKRFRSFAPKGSKLAEGYTDRSQNRTSEESDDRAARIKALEESLKNEEIDQETFNKLRSEIAGGDLSSTHLVKGLDFKLLERIRKGDNVYEENKAEAESPEQESDVEDEFERLEEKEITTVNKERGTKKGQLSTEPLNPSKKRTRDQILAEMKAAREAAKAKEASMLGSKFKKIGAKKPGTRIERDNRGREVMIIVDEDGHEKRKVRKVHSSSDEPPEKPSDLMMPDPKIKPLGTEVPEFYKERMQKAEDEDDGDVDIFDDVGDDYDPLAGLGEEDEDEEDEDLSTSKPEKALPVANDKEKDAMPPPPRPATNQEHRNYFKDAKTSLVSSETLTAPSMSDPAIQAAFKKAASLSHISKPNDDYDDEEARAKAERRRKMLQNDDRDAEDMDMGFGMSRFEDEADFEDQKVKLSQWGGQEGEDEDGQGKGGSSKRKRGPKKRKGDANNVADVLSVMEKRRGAE